MANTNAAPGVGSVSFTGLQPVKPQTATIQGTLPAVTGALTAKRDATAQIAGTLPKLTGRMYTGAVLDATLPALRGALGGTIPPFATIDIILPALTGSIHVTAGVVARIAGTLPAMTMRAYTGGIITGTLPSLAGALTATIEVHATILGELPALQGSLNVLSEGPVARIAGVLPALRPGVTARIAGVLPMLQAAIAVARQAVAEGWLINLRNGAVTRLDSWPFTQFAKLGNATFAVAPGEGLYTLGGDFLGDGTSPVAWEFETGLSDLGTPATKHFPYLYLDAIVTGEIEVTLLDDRGREYRYLYTGKLGPKHMRHRRKLGNGIRTTNVGFRIGSPKGAYFEMDAMEPEVNLTQRSI